jgi:hypothetical protein
MEEKEYKKLYIKDAVRNYFGNSFQQMVSFFAREEEIELAELEQLIKKIRQENTENDK